MADSHPSASLNAKERQALFLEMAAQADDVTAQQVYEEATRRGDSVTVEAYHNLGRRLVHRGLLVNKGTKGKHTTFALGAAIDSQWLDEEHLASIIDPEYPLVALTVLREARRQLSAISETVWEEIRTRLRAENAQNLFFEQICSYANDLQDAFREYMLVSDSDSAARNRMRGQIDSSILLLKQLTKYGLGLSDEAIRVPFSIDAGIGELKQRPNEPLYNEEHLRDELSRRVSNEMFVVDINDNEPDPALLIAAVDGSTRGGLLTLDGEEGDFALGHAPSVSINTAVAQINRRVKVAGREYPAFLRLPEKPEDMQQHDNRYTVMAKIFFPELSDSQYAHSIWNAMNLLECRAAIKVMKRWDTSRNSVEVRPADVVLMDGPVVPNARDSNHYAQPDTYGRIVRDLIEANSEILSKSHADNQVVAGVVKNAQLRVIGPIINRFIAKTTALDKKTQIEAWPLQAMNTLPDQTILTRILTAGRRKGDTWCRTCYVARPFHAATDFSERYSRTPEGRPAGILRKRVDQARARKLTDDASDQDRFWADFQFERDPFLKLLENAWYAGFFLGAVPRLDQKQALPRIEVLVSYSTEESGPFNEGVLKNCNTLIESLKLTGFEVSADHAMFGAKGWIDVVPRLLVDVHQTVKIWAAELQSRVQEYIGYHVSRYIKGGGHRGVRIRPWRRAELEAWAVQMRDERRRQAGAGSRDGQIE
jgi:hypothetical protein